MMMRFANLADEIGYRTTKVDFRKEDEEGLITGLVWNTPGAWEEFQRRYNATITKRIKWVVSRCGRKYRASDVVEEIRSEFYHALLTNDRRRLRAFDPKRGKLTNWLSMIAGQTALRVLQRNVRDAVLVPLDVIEKDDGDTFDEDEGGDGQIGARWIAHGI